jgi:ribosomal protein S18 acetylase RimI-like enzyme
MRAISDNLADPVDVRLGDAGDLDDLLALLRDCVRDMQGRGLDQWDDVYPDRATLAADLDARSLYVAARGAPPGERLLVGAFTLNQRQEAEYADVAWRIIAAPIAVVHRLMVSPLAQRRGIGRFLMRFAEAEAYRLGFRAIRLDTLDDNARALAFYRSLGYCAAGGVRFRKGAFTCFEKALPGPNGEG